MTVDQRADRRQESAGEDFWTAAARGILQLQRCTHCRRYRFFPEPICPGCLQPGGEWTAVSGQGRLYSFTVVHRAPSAQFAPEVPYTIALVDLAEGPRLMARIEDCPPETLRSGTPLIFAGTGDSGAGPWLRFRVTEPGTE